MAKLQELESFFQDQLPQALYVTPTSPGYEDLRHAYIIGNTQKPLAIARPKNAEEVALLVNYATSAGIDITVRTGGHDLFGRCFVQDALALDMRDISYVNVANDRSSASVGGGILTGNLTATLADHGLATAIGTISTVGYVGWSTHGGYGPFAANFGLGLDQIIGARVINSIGEIVEADSDMLGGIRGAGGTLGVIVELTIRVYPLEKILGGVIVYESSNLASAIETFEVRFSQMAKEGLPDALNVQHVVANTPMGRCFTASVTWSSWDFDKGRQYVERLSSFGTVLNNGVKEMSILEWFKESETFVPKSAYGRSISVYVRELTDEVVKITGQEVSKMPNDRSTLFSTHELRGPSAKANEESVFSARTPHFLIELIATSSDAERADRALEWASSSQDALRRTDLNNVLPMTYISLTPPEESKLETIYQEYRDKLVKIKKRYDPDNVFRHALPNSARV